MVLLLDIRGVNIPRRVLNYHHIGTYVLDMYFHRVRYYTLTTGQYEPLKMKIFHTKKIITNCYITN